MKLPDELPECPSGWFECEICANEKECKAGLYKPEETDIEVVIKAAEVSKKVVDTEVLKNVESIRGGSWFEEFSKLSYNDRMKEGARYHPPSLHDKTPIPLDGPSSPGGGGKCRVPKKPQRKLPEYMKMLGI